MWNAGECWIDDDLRLWQMVQARPSVCLHAGTETRSLWILAKSHIFHFSFGGFVSCLWMDRLLSPSDFHSIHHYTDYLVIFPFVCCCHKHIKFLGRLCCCHYLTSSFSCRIVYATRLISPAWSSNILDFGYCFIHLLCFHLINVLFSIEVCSVSDPIGRFPHKYCDFIRASTNTHKYSRYTFS